MDCSDFVSQTRFYCKITKVRFRFGISYLLRRHSTILRNDFDKHFVQNLDVGGDGVTGGIRQRFMRITVNLRFAFVNVGPLNPGLLVSFAHVDMSGDDTDASNVAGARRPNHIGRRGDGVSCRSRVFIGVTPNRNIAALRHFLNVIYTIKARTGFATRRIYFHEQPAKVFDRTDFIDCAVDGVVTYHSAHAVKPRPAPDQCPDDAQVSDSGVVNHAP